MKKRKIFWRPEEFDKDDSWVHIGLSFFVLNVAPILLMVGLIIGLITLVVTFPPFQ